MDVLFGARLQFYQDHGSGSAYTCLCSARRALFGGAREVVLLLDRPGACGFFGAAIRLILTPSLGCLFLCIMRYQTLS